MRRSIITTVKKLLEHAQSIQCKRKERAMQLCETLSLGDRRFLALVKVGQQKFLVGAAGGTVSLLTQIPAQQAPEACDLQANNGALFAIKECKTWK